MKEINLLDLEKQLNDIPKDSELFIKHSFGISRFVLSFLKANEISQKELADRLGKTEAEISKWLNGQHNFTLRSLCKIEAALGVNIINVPARLATQRITIKQVVLKNIPIATEQGSIAKSKVAEIKAVSTETKFPQPGGKVVYMHKSGGTKDNNGDGGTPLKAKVF